MMPPPAPDHDAEIATTLLEEQIDEGLARDEGILDFMGHAGGESADTGQAIELLDVLLNLPDGGQVVEHEHDSGILAACLRGDSAGLEDHGSVVAGSELDLAIGGGFARRQCLANHSPQRRGQGSRRRQSSLVRAQAEELSRPGVERRNLPFAVNENHPRREAIMQQIGEAQAFHGRLDVRRLDD